MTQADMIHPMIIDDDGLSLLGWWLQVMGYFWLVYIQFNSQIKSWMADTKEEEGETIEFYKIQVMEKDREISDFQTKIKKIQFKHNRQLKEAKVAEERAKTLLKEEKTKVDKITKQAKQNQEQNNILQLRVTELKQSKEKEILQIRGQYNSIKQQIRSYQKILPTHTFLIEIDKTINELPAYQDIFMSLKDKALQLEELNHKFDQFKLRNEEDLVFLRQNEQNLKNKKIQAESSLKEMLSKVIDYEHTINDLKISSEDYQTRIEELNTLLQSQKAKNNQLEQAIKTYEIKMQQLEQAFAHEMQNKQNEIKLQLKEEFDRLQHENKTLSSRLQLKQNSYINQINIYEEDINAFQNRYILDKDRHEEELTQRREIIHELKKQLDNAKKDLDQANHKTQELVTNLKQVSESNEELQEKVITLQKKQLQIVEENKARLEDSLQKSQKKIQNAEQYKEEMQFQLGKAKQALLVIVEEKKHLQEEISELRHDMLQIKRNGENEERFTENLDFPSSSELEYVQKFRRKSMESGYQEDLLFQLQERQEQIRERNNNTQSKRLADVAIDNSQVVDGESQEFKNTIEQLQQKFQRSQNYYKEKEQSFINLQQKFSLIQHQNQTLLSQLSSTKQIIATLEVQRKTLLEEKGQLIVQMKRLQSQKESLKVRFQSQTQSLRKKFQSQKQSLRESFQSQRQIFKERTSSLSKLNAQLQTNIQSIQTKVDLYKVKNESYQQQMKILVEQSKKERELIKSQKQEIKGQKQQMQIAAQKKGNIVKDQHTQIEALRQDKEKLKAETTSKQKNLHIQIDRLKNDVFLSQKLKEQIKGLQDQVKSSEEQKVKLGQKLQDIIKEKQELRKQVMLLEEENKNKDRENEMISGSLDRQRRQRTLRSVPSLQSLNGEAEQAEEETFNDIYSTVTKKQGEINILQRQISDLKEEIEQLRISYLSKIETIEIEQTEYIQTVIAMKMKCAQSQMRASEKEYLYSKLKKKMDMLTGGKG